MHLSIIIPCFNAGKYVERSINSIFQNKIHEKFNLEVFVVNDGSTDNSLVILKKLEQSRKINVISKENGGVSSAINVGIDAATGKYAFIMAADDWCDAKVIFQKLEIALTYELDLVAFEMQIVDEQMSYLRKKNIFNGPYDEIISGEKCLISGYQPSSICLFLISMNLFKQQKLRFYDGTQNDVEISTKLMLHSKKVMFTYGVGYYYYRNSGSITMPKTKESLQRYLFDAVRIATLGRENTKQTTDVALKKVLEQNNNSIVWNLLWRFVSNPKEVDYAFKIHCLHEMKKRGLYPIQGSLKTPFQKVSTWIFNREQVLKAMCKIRS